MWLVWMRLPFVSLWLLSITGCAYLGAAHMLSLLDIALRVFDGISCGLVNPNHFHLSTCGRRDLVSRSVFQEKSAKTWLQGTLC